ncbi:MAG TPA: RimK family alpha-L-glutamate ligase [Verrucomicrobiae bacterium]|nr:RimK family alpha-L-glutamate ligase [Verrucomicrobiae bacterium]
MKIGILTHLPNYYTERRLEEEAQKRGHDVMMIRSSASHVEINSEHPTVIYQGQALDDLNAVIPRILPSASSYGNAILRQFEMMGVYTTAKSLAIGRSHDVLRSLQLLNKAGVGIPKTIITREPSQIDNLLERVGLPAVIKVAQARNNHAVLVESQKAANSVLQAFYMGDADLLIQEYAGNTTEEIQDVRAVVVGSTVVASVKREGSARSFFSSSGKQEYGMSAKLTEQERKLAVKAARAIGLSVCVVDMLLTPSRQFVLRLDSAPALESIEQVTGRNIAGKIIDYVELNAPRRNKKDKVGA